MRAIVVIGVVCAVVGVFQSVAWANDAPIVDNSFFVEEAYNQEAGVIQHVQTLDIDPDSGDWAYMITDEWPVDDETNQVSLSIPVTRLGDRYGVGDVMLNYRRRLHHSERLLVTPRLSLWLPTGDTGRGLGDGLFGVQAQLCVSILFHRSLVAHSNLGATVPMQNSSRGVFFTVAQSVIWLVHPKFNVMAEAVWNRPAMRIRDGGTESEQVILSPGIRTGIDLDSGMQVVPGLAVPLRIDRKESSWGALVYLSIEHALPVQESNEGR